MSRLQLTLTISLDEADRPTVDPACCCPATAEPETLVAGAAACC